MKPNRIHTLLLLGSLLYIFPLTTRAQQQPDSLTLEQIIDFALQNKPALQQSQLDEEIADREVKASLAGWLPQIGANFNVAHYLKMPVTIFPNEQGVLVPRTIGTVNSSNIQLQTNQTLFNQDVLLAARGSRFVRLQADQNTIETKINTVVTVSKAFYDILLTQEQLRILDEAIVRQEKQLADSKAQYEQGLVDKTDYQRASILLGNTQSDRKRTQEAIKAKTAYLKEQIGMKPEQNLRLAYNRQQMESQMPADTTQNVTYTNRIEIQQLQTQKQLQDLNISYYRWGFLPTVSAFGNYNYVYLNNEFSQLYTSSFPNSQIGLSAGIPIFQGGRRLQRLRIAQLQDRQLDLAITNTQSIINTEYQTALANYKSDLNEWETVRNNVAMAEDVYRIIKLQYDEGIKSYLEVITAETDLRTTQLNYFNALYRVLSSKLDLERAMGTVNIDK